MEKLFQKIANRVAHDAGKPVTFLTALGIVFIWAITGPIFKFSETWQLVINTGTTIITFLMMFLIQNTQNRDGLAIQAKLDELIAATEAARNDLEHVEDLTEEEIRKLRR